jgi:hypothetical protein
MCAKENIVLIFFWQMITGNYLFLMTNLAVKMPTLHTAQ